jgi:hypothetical protein
MLETITDHEAGRFFAGTLEGPGVDWDLRVDFEDRGQTTLLRFSGGVRSASFFMKLLMPFMKGAIRKRQRGDIETFKRLVEAGEL